MELLVRLASPRFSAEKSGTSLMSCSKSLDPRGQLGRNPFAGAQRAGRNTTVWPTTRLRCASQLIRAFRMPLVGEVKWASVERLK